MKFVIFILVLLCVGCGTRQKSKTHFEKELSRLTAKDVSKMNDSFATSGTNQKKTQLSQLFFRGLKVNVKATDSTKPITYTDTEGKKHEFENVEINFETYDLNKKDSIIDTSEHTESAHQKKTSTENSKDLINLNETANSLEVSRDFNWGILGWLVIIISGYIIIRKLIRSRL